MSKQTHELELIIPEAAIDQMGHVNNVKYLQWIQDVAQSHWQEKASAKMLKEYAWVALEHHIKYHNPSFKDEKITIKTWVESFEGVKSIRHTKIFRKSDSKTLVTAETVWCLLRLPEAKPTRITQELADAF